MKATIDRIEGEVAVLITREGEPARITLPLSLLPGGCREGDIVTIGISREGEMTSAARKDVAGLVEKLRKKRQC